MATEYSTTEYQASHGKMPRTSPDRVGYWMFTFFFENGEQDRFDARGDYSVAKKAAMAEAKRRGAFKVSVCP